MTRMDDMDPPSGGGRPALDEAEAARMAGTLRFLRRLVTTLTAVMILGLLTVSATLVIRLSGPTTPPMPDEIALPDGAAAIAVTQGGDWIAVVTDDDRILIFDRATGALRQSVQVRAVAPGDG